MLRLSTGYMTVNGSTSALIGCATILRVNLWSRRKQNVEAGAKLLKLLLGKYDNDLTLTLSAYNAGSGRVDQEGGIPPIPETLNYVADILRKLRPTEDKPVEPAPAVAASEHKDQ